jgi:hypothetical protein
MSIMRRFELICGVLSGVLGLAGVGIAFFAPLGTECTSSLSSPGVTTQSTCLRVSYVAAQGLGSVMPYLIVLGLFCAIVVLGALGHSLSGSGAWRAVLWTGAALLLTSSILGLLSIGVFLLPGALLALVAAVLSSLGARGPARAVPSATVG